MKTLKTNTQLVALVAAWAATTAFAQPMYDVVKFGAKGDGVTVNTASIQSAIDQCGKDGGGRVVFPNGTFLSATIHIKSNVTLYLNEGAVLKGVADMKAYQRLYASNYAFIYAEKQDNIAILGRGVIHGQGEHKAFQGGSSHSGIKNRPNTIFLVECNHVSLKDFTIRNGARWNMKLDLCHNVSMDGLSVFSRVVANDDGVDFDDCHDVRVSNCFFETGDDGICAKSYSSHGVKRLVINNCIVSSFSNGIKLGAVSVGSFEDIAVSNCAIYDTRLSGITLQNVDGSVMDRVVINNITMSNVNGGIFLKVGTRKKIGGKLAPPGAIRNVFISNVIADGVGCWLPDKTRSYYKEAYDSRIGVGLAGQPGYRIENVHLSNIHMRFSGGGTAEDAKVVMQDLPDVYPEYRNWGVTPAYAFNCRHVKDLQFNNVSFDYLNEDARPAMFFEDAEGIVLNHVNAKTSDKAKASIRAKDVKDMFIHSNKPEASPTPFLAFEGCVNDITIMNNDFHRLKAVYTAEAETDTNEVRMANNISK